jgi:hypothetical protein
VDPKHLYADNHRLKNADGKTLTIGIMTGTTTESFLLSPCEGGPRHSPWNMHKITIAPFTQEMRRDTSLWGLVLDFHIIAGLTTSLGFTFSTRAEGRGDSQNTCASFQNLTLPIAHGHCSLCIWLHLIIEVKRFEVRFFFVACQECRWGLCCF